MNGLPNPGSSIEPQEALRPADQSSPVDRTTSLRPAELHPSITVHSDTLKIPAAGVQRLISDVDLTLIRMESLHKHVVHTIGCSMLPAHLTGLPDAMIKKIEARCFHRHRDDTYEGLVEILREEAEKGEGGVKEGTLAWAMKGVQIGYILGLVDEYFAHAATDPETLNTLAEVDHAAVDLICAFKARGADCTVCTGSARIPVTAVLRGFGLECLFNLERSVFSDDVPKADGKPNGRPYVLNRERAEAMNIRGGELALEDNVTGALAAVSAGMRVIVRPSSDDPEGMIRQLSQKLHALEAQHPDFKLGRIDVVMGFDRVEVV